MLKKLLLLISLLALPAFADSTAEINHLLNYVKTTECKYIRNGSVAHVVWMLLAHIKNKYDYFKDEIKSAEDFIRLSATKSTMSGSKYYILCPRFF